MPSIKSSRLLELDSLRGIAAVFVVLFHLTMDRFKGKSIFHLGLTGVELFFIISGFVIFMTIEKVTTSKEFIISRVSRLYPTYWFCVTVTMLSYILTKTAVAHNIIPFYLGNLTMFQSYLFINYLDGSYWTMTVEMVFYIYMLLLFASGYFRKTISISTILLIPLFIYGVWISYKFPGAGSKVFKFLGLVQFFPLFFSGILYYHLKFKERKNSYYILLLVCFLVQISLFHTIPFRSSLITFQSYISMVLLYNAVFLLYIFGKLKFIVNPLTVFLGNISYPLYLIHQFVSLNVIMPLLLKYTSFWPAIIIDLIIVILIGYLINLFIEAPALRYSRSKWLKRPISKIAIENETIKI